jgi:hypothetical protein
MDARLIAQDSFKRIFVGTGESSNESSNSPRETPVDPLQDVGKTELFSAASIVI